MVAPAPAIVIACPLRFQIAALLNEPKVIWLMVQGISTTGDMRVANSEKVTEVVLLLAGATPPDQLAPVLQLLSGPLPNQVCAVASHATDAARNSEATHAPR